jgi:hypothetical protein
VNDAKSRRSVGPQLNPTSLFLTRGHEVVAALTINGFDAPWTLADFAPGPAYPRYRDIFEAEAHARHRLEDAQASGGASEELEKIWDAMRSSLNALELVLSGKAIRDARLLGDGKIQFVMSD